MRSLEVPSWNITTWQLKARLTGMNPHARLNTQYSGASSRRTALATSLALGSSVSAPSQSKTQTAEKDGYRADIDGLRAIAVGLVLLYHAGFSSVRGGFVGVDIFFVISGFLITRILLSDLQVGQFSIANFYERRIRRIVPALTVMLIIVLAVAPFVLFSSEMTKLSFAALAAVGSVSNLYLLSTAGYFAADSSMQPLVHTWSLGVEEQFYLLLPVILVAFGPNRLSAARWTIAGLTLISFIACVALTSVSRETAYYLPFTRAWEPLLGSFLAFARLPRMPRLLCESSALAGLVLILLSAMRFHSGLFFPGAYALVPCLGTALIILAGGGGKSLLTRALSVRPLVGVGQLSYSLYLWHWPIFVFYGLHTGTPRSLTETVGLIALCFGVATVSWRFVELPFRQKQILPSRGGLFAAAGAASFGLAICALGFVALSNRPSNPRSESERLAGFMDYDDEASYRRGTCFLIGDKQSSSDLKISECLTPSNYRSNVLLVGDSHAAHLWSGLSTNLQNSNVMQATASGCKPVLGTRGRAGCVELMHRIFEDFLTSQRPDTLILSGRWIADDIPALERTISALQGRAGRIVVFGPIVEYQQPLPRLLAQVSAGRPASLVDEARLQAGALADRKLAGAVEGAGATYVSVRNLLCSVSGASCTTVWNGTPVQFDYGHLTAEGSSLVMRRAIEAGYLKTQ